LRRCRYDEPKRVRLVHPRRGRNTPNSPRILHANGTRLVSADYMNAVQQQVAS
jgi:hypothetical protein